MTLAQVLLLVFGSGSLASVAPTVPSDPGVTDLGLPPVRAPLEFPAGQEEVTLSWLLAELSRLTGQELSIDPTLRQQLDISKERLEITSPVPAEEVYAFVEALVLRESVFLAPLKGGTRPVLGVFGGARQPSANSVRAIPVTVERLAEMEAHPAVLCQIVMHFEHLDARQVQTQLRQLLVDNTGTQQVIPCGESSLLLQGLGAKMAGLVRLLAEVDRTSVAHPANDTPSTESSMPSTGPKPGPSGKG